MRRTLRTVSVLLAFAAWLFAQGVVAAHGLDSMKACHGGGNPAIACVEHCAGGVPFAANEPVDSPPVASMRIPIPLPTPLLSEPARAMDPALARATAPPLAILHCCLRI